MKITLAQLNPIVGDVDGNVNKIIQTLKQTQAENSDLIVFPELFLSGYPPLDLLERKWFIKKIEKAIGEIVTISSFYPNTGIIFGAPLFSYKDTGRGLYNSAILVYRGLINHIQHKSLLPTYDVFDEARYFDPASDIKPIQFKEEVLGISICEDAWNIPELWHRQFYDRNPIQTLIQRGASILINISASPFTVDKEKIRFRILQEHTQKYRVPFVFVNQVGANDELIFDGRSMFLDNDGLPVEIFPAFTECIKTIDTNKKGNAENYKPLDDIESVYNALVLGVRDYLQKCGFEKVVIGLSGGIDSALVACIAVEAIGKENVLGVAMPGPFSSRESVEDSKKLAKNLDIELKIIPITDVYFSYLNSLKEIFKDKEFDTTEENIQARIRGNILMAISNKFGHLVLTTGNKSEMAVGYCTLYGDMSGGLAVIADIPKTMVYKIAKFINRDKTLIPDEIIKKLPSAELRPNQLDQDTLPPYEILDPILQMYIEDGLSREEIVARGYKEEIVDWVIKAVNKNEYKRRQAPPVLKVTSKAFGPGRRMPVAAKF
ncbi:MAG: NAD+ synthase [candidate division WOR-3 bacterium]|nr:NAD+ synthase [candidate division WOR-3 bacterium]